MSLATHKITSVTACIFVLASLIYTDWLKTQQGLMEGYAGAPLTYCARKHPPVQRAFADSFPRLRHRRLVRTGTACQQTECRVRNAARCDALKSKPK